MKDHHEILGVRRGATAAELRAAYRRKAKQTHPDTSGSAERAAFQEVQEAYEALRTQLDRREAVPLRRSPAGPAATGRFDPPPGLTLEIWMDPLEAGRGGLLSLVVPLLRSCAACRGTGRRWPGGCPHCGGAGRLRHELPLTLHIPPGLHLGTRQHIPIGGGLTLDLLIRVERR
jgi:DnaJ-class molecular chaperone